jgi:hypothetical protein
MIFKNFDRLEGINFRSNGIDDDVAVALAEGIKLKKELRVSNDMLFLDA